MIIAMEIQCLEGHREVFFRVRYLFAILLIVLGKMVHPGDTSLMTYRGHKVFQTLIRSYFSPSETTGQKYIYTGSSDCTLYGEKFLGISYL
jgi:hypothetical protein